MATKSILKDINISSNRIFNKSAQKNDIKINLSEAKKVRLSTPEIRKSLIEKILEKY